MELYGNVNNLPKSMFEFDKIYSNYKDAIDNWSQDGVLVNRYVLINYSNNNGNRLYNLAIDNGFYNNGLNGTIKEPTYQQIIDFVRAKGNDAVLQDYDHSILVKTQESY